jgi:hypothetical protein
MSVSPRFGKARDPLHARDGGRHVSSAMTVKELVEMAA